MVAAIDFGSAYSGCAFSFKSNFIKNPLEICVMGIGQKGLESLKVPTVLLLDPNKNFSAFGFEAEEKYTELIQDDPDAANNWYYFSRFKMQLYQNRVRKFFFNILLVPINIMKVTYVKGVSLQRGICNRTYFILHYGNMFCRYLKQK